MEQLMDDMEEEMSTTFKVELEMFYRMSGIFIQMCMIDAEAEKKTIKAEVNYMENYKKLQEMKDFEELVMNQDFSLTKRAMPTAKLPSLSTPVQVQKVVVKDEETQQLNKQLTK
jgi:hypothetical protein